MVSGCLRFFRPPWQAVVQRSTLELEPRRRKPKPKLELAWDSEPRAGAARREKRTST